MELNEQCVGLLEHLYDEQLEAMRVEGSVTDWFNVGKGVRDLVSPLLFNCYLKQIMRESVDDLSWIGMWIGGRIINNLRYADYIVLIAQSSQTLQLLSDKVHSVSKEYVWILVSRKQK